jgi:hypothetical protein
MSPDGKFQDIGILYIASPGCLYGIGSRDIYFKASATLHLLRGSDPTTSF